MRKLLCLLALSSLFACKTADSSVSSSETPAEAPAASTLEAGSNLRFVGCVPSLGECRMSCPERDGQGVVDAERCPDAFAPVACGCPGGDEAPPTPPNPNEYAYVGCVPSPSECRYSCPSKQIITYRGADNCSENEFSCYCRF